MSHFASCLMYLGLSFGGYREGKLHITIGTKQFAVCRRAFTLATDRGHTYYDKVMTSILLSTTDN